MLDPAPETTAVAPAPPRSLTPEQEAAAVEMLKQIGGSEYEHWNAVIVGQVINALWLANATPEQAVEKQVAAVAAMRGINPTDEIEGMLAAQMVATHNAAMECHRRAMLPEQFDGARQYNLSQANKLSRTFATLLETLNRHRGKGQQKVTVEHVHVYPGGQAVVGTVSHPRPAGGEVQNSGQAHAADNTRAIALTPSPALRGENTERQSVPVAGCERQEAVPHARRSARQRSPARGA